MAAFSVMTFRLGTLVDDVKLFAGFEANCLAGCDGDFGAGAGIAAYAGFAGLYGEDAEAAEFDAVALDEALLHGFEDGVDCSFCFGPDQSGTFDDTLNEILLDHFCLAVIVRSILFGERLVRVAAEQQPTSRIGSNISLQKRVAGPAFLSFGPFAMVERGRVIVNVGLRS